MNLIIIHKKRNLSANNGTRLLQFSTCNKPMADITLSCVNNNYCSRNNHNHIVIPKEWAFQTAKAKPAILYYENNILLPQTIINRLKNDDWFIISNGKFATTTDCKQLSKIFNKLNADLITVNIDPAIASYREKIRITSHGNVAGIRRSFSTSILPTPVSSDWPHHIFVKTSILDKILVDDTLPLSFAEFWARCKSNSLNRLSLKIGGTVMDLETETGLLNLLKTRLQPTHFHARHTNNHSCYQTTQKATHVISATARIFGTVLLGNNVHIGDNAVIVGPAILSDNVKIASAATITTSIIGPGISIPKAHFVKNCVLLDPESQHKLFSRYYQNNAGELGCTIPSPAYAENGSINNNFRKWPIFSYPRCVKRIADILISLVILILFAPVFLLIAIILKLSSPCPVFFKDKRQGLQGREFYCLKFGTMIAGADKIQEKLRHKNQVDGPQFKIENDPRVTMLGKFLRNTYIDELPQLINILLGQMSLVGPRPSPKAENCFCPFWRDARLSVRPGITGLWQIRRTRRPGHDFQEWIYYDTKYVRSISLRLDLSICWKTAKKLITNFIDQF